MKLPLLTRGFSYELTNRDDTALYVAAFVKQLTALQFPKHKLSKNEGTVFGFVFIQTAQMYVILCSNAAVFVLFWGYHVQIPYSLL